MQKKKETKAEICLFFSEFFSFSSTQTPPSNSILSSVSSLLSDCSIIPLEVPALVVWVGSGLVAGLVEGVHILIRELQGDGVKVVNELVHLLGTDDGRGHSRVLHDPPQADLGDGPLVLFSNSLGSIEDGKGAVV